MERDRPDRRKAVLEAMTGMGKQCTVMVRSGWTSEAEGTIGSQGDREPLEGIIQKIGCG